MSDESKDESKDKKDRDVLTEDQPGHLPQDDFGDPDYPRKKDKKGESLEEDKEGEDDESEPKEDEDSGE